MMIFVKLALRIFFSVVYVRSLLIYFANWFLNFKSLFVLQTFHTNFGGQHEAPIYFSTDQFQSRTNILLVGFLKFANRSMYLKTTQNIFSDTFLILI